MSPAGHHDRERSQVKWGGIWEITPRVNVPEPLSTELKKTV
jgi:hypothetical protein